MKSLMLLPVLVGLAACDVNFDTDKPIKGPEKVAVAGTADGKVKFDLPFANGTINLPEGMMKNANFDIDGVKMYPGASVTGFNFDAEDGKALVDMSFTAPAAPAAVRGYFLEQFKAKGVEAVAEGEGVRGTSKSGDRFTMSFAPGGSGTQGQIKIDSARP